MIVVACLLLLLLMSYCCCCCDGYYWGCCCSCYCCCHGCSRVVVETCRILPRLLPFCCRRSNVTLVCVVLRMVGAHVLLRCCCLLLWLGWFSLRDVVPPTPGNVFSRFWNLINCPPWTVNISYPCLLALDLRLVILGGRFWCAWGDGCDTWLSQNNYNWMWQSNHDKFGCVNVEEKLVVKWVVLKFFIILFFNWVFSYRFFLTE